MKIAKRLDVLWTPAGLDVAERTIVLLLYVPLCWNLVLGFAQTGQWPHLVLLASEGAAVAFVLIRRSTNVVSVRPLDWILAVVGAALPLLARPGDGYALAPVSSCAMLMLVGFAMQIAAKFTLRRSFGIVAANRGVKISGPYALVRHPMYAGYALTHIGFLLLNATWWNGLVYTVAFACQIVRILSEERLLENDDRYRLFQNSVRYRLIPGLF